MSLVLFVLRKIIKYNFILTETVFFLAYGFSHGSLSKTEYLCRNFDSEVSFITCIGNGGFQRSTG